MTSLLCEAVLTLLMPVVCLLAAAAGVISAADCGKLPGFMKFSVVLAGTFLWVCAGTLLLPHLGLGEPLSNLTVYGLWSLSGFAPYAAVLFRVPKTGVSQIPKGPAIWGALTHLFFCATLGAALCRDVFPTAAGSRCDALPDTLCRNMLPPVFLFFLPLFFLTALVLGTCRKKSAGFLSNLLLSAAAPCGLLLVTAIGLETLSRDPSGGTTPMFLAIALWQLLLFVPWGLMALRGRREKDERKFCNGISGLGAAVFFDLGLLLLGYIGRSV